VVELLDERRSGRCSLQRFHQGDFLAQHIVHEIVKRHALAHSDGAEVGVQFIAQIDGMAAIKPPRTEFAGISRIGGMSE
jgi:hypothetical protein